MIDNELFEIMRPQMINDVLTALGTTIEMVSDK